MLSNEDKFKLSVACLKSLLKDEMLTKTEFEKTVEALKRIYSIDENIAM